MLGSSNSQVKEIVLRRGYLGWSGNLVCYAEFVWKMFSLCGIMRCRSKR